MRLRRNDLLLPLPCIAYLTQARADRVIEVRGQESLHLHLDRDAPRRPVSRGSAG